MLTYLLTLLETEDDKALLTEICRDVYRETGDLHLREYFTAKEA